jgi:hypothetical protein
MRCLFLGLLAAAFQLSFSWGCTLQIRHKAMQQGFSVFSIAIPQPMSS